MAQSPEPDRKRSRRPARRHWIALAVLVILFGAGYGFFGVAIRASRTLLPGNGIEAPGVLAALPGLATPDGPTSRIYVLVMGVDHRLGKGDEYLPQIPGMPTDPGRSDTMAVVSIDPATRSASVLSIPRDMWLEVPDGRGGWTMDRINEPYHTGEIDKLPGGGGALAAMAINHNFGIPIDYWVEIDFDGFMSLFDSLGGVDLNVPAQLTATVLPRNNSGAYEYTFFPGPQHMTGEMALAYSRFRLDSQGDFGRIQRQQAVMLAARQKALALGWVDHPLDVWQKYNATLSTNIPAYKLPGLALLARQIDPSDITVRSLGETGVLEGATIPGSGADVLYPHPVAVSQIVFAAFGDPNLGRVTLTQLRRLYTDLAQPIPQTPTTTPTFSPASSLPGRPSVPASAAP